MSGARGEANGHLYNEVRARHERRNMLKRMHPELENACILLSGHFYPKPLQTHFFFVKKKNSHIRDSYSSPWEFFLQIHFCEEKKFTTSDRLNVIFSQIKKIPGF